MSAVVTIWTDEELTALPKARYKRELRQGEIVMGPVGSEHEMICVRVINPAELSFE